MSRSLEYASGGYFLTKRFRRREWMSAELVPENVVSLSPCVTEVIPDSWYLNQAPNQTNLDIAAKMGVPLHRLAELYPWMKRHPPEPADMWPYAFSTLDRAREFAREFLQGAADVLLLGTSLHKEFFEAFLSEAGPVHGYSRFGKDATYVYVSERTEVLKLGLPPADGGNILGFEVFGDAVMERHTLLCTGGEKDVRAELGIRLNQNGLFETLADARRVAQWASVEGHAEPFLYLPWRLEQYQW